MWAKSYIIEFAVPVILAAMWVATRIAGVIAKAEVRAFEDM